MNKTQKIIIREMFGLGLAIPSALIIFEYLLLAIKEVGFFSIFGSFGNVLLFILNILLIYQSYEWIIDISKNIEKTERLMYSEKDKFNCFLVKIFLTFIVTFILILVIKNLVGI